MSQVPPLPPTPPLPGQAPAIGVAAPQAGAQVLPYAALEPREGQLSNVLRDLRSQRSILLEQLRSRDPAMMTAASAQIAAVDAKIKTVGDELASVRTQMALQGPPPTPRSGEAGSRPRGNGPGPEVVVMGIGVTFTLAVLMPLSIAYARRLWRRTTTGPVAADTVGPRLDRIEQAVDAIAIEIERISEGQRFVTKVMTERPAPARASAMSITPESVQAQQQAVGEAKPFLALGAGPIEPIRLAERQKVRQSITPH